MINCLTIAVYAYAGCLLISLSVDESLILRYMYLNTNFREPPFSVDMSPS